MNNNWLSDLKINLPLFLKDLRKHNGFTFYPVKKGLTKHGEDVELGMSCYALKIFYITNQWTNLEKKEQVDWVNFINSFQSTDKNFPQNSYIDQAYLKEMKKFSPIKFLKDFVKRILNKYVDSNYTLLDEFLQNSIKAESKQAISSIYQVGYKNKKIYSEFPKDKKEINDYLSNLNWAFPWDAGAQFSNLCFFVQTQITNQNEKDEIKSILEEFILTIHDSKTGAYFTGEPNDDNEIINGAMKVLTGFDWLNISIHSPEKLIDFCLNSKIRHEGCDIVDIVYVLFRCYKNTNYRKKEIENYFKKILINIKDNYYPNGGFSYFRNKSQTHYYGTKISNGLNEPDLHGTLLLVWAIALISDIIELPTSDWKIIKP